MIVSVWPLFGRAVAAVQGGVGTSGGGGGRAAAPGSSPWAWPWTGGEGERHGRGAGTQGVAAAATVHTCNTQHSLERLPPHCSRQALASQVRSRPSSKQIQHKTQNVISNYATLSITTPANR